MAGAYPWLGSAGTFEASGREVWLLRLPASVPLATLDGATLALRNKATEEDGGVLRRVARGAGCEAPWTAEDEVVVREERADATVRVLVRSENGGARVSRRAVTRVLAAAYLPRAEEDPGEALSAEAHFPRFLTEPDYSETAPLAADVRGPALAQTLFATATLTTRAAYRAQRQVEGLRVRFRPNGSNGGDLGRPVPPPGEMPPKKAKRDREGGGDDKAPKKKKKRKDDDAAAVAAAAQQPAADASETSTTTKKKKKKKKKPDAADDAPPPPTTAQPAEEPPKKKKKKKKAAIE